MCTNLLRITARLGGENVRVLELSISSCLTLMEQERLYVFFAQSAEYSSSGESTKARELQISSQ